MLDKKDLPVGLSSADFVLREDNTPQKIVSVEEHIALGDTVAATPTVGPTDGTVVASNKPPAGSVWNVLLIDLYNTPNAILEYNAKGKVLDKSLIRLSGKMTPDQRSHLSSKTLSAKQTIKLRVGATNLVLGVRDQVSGRLGRVEVPLGSP